MKLKKVHLKGYRSVSSVEEQQIEFGEITVLLGANGSGKSNLGSFFSMLGHMTTGGLTDYVGRHGVRQLLFYGPKKTESIWFRLEFESADAYDEYEVKLSHGLPDRLFVSSEKVTFHESGKDDPQEYFLEEGGSEAGLGTDERKTSKVLRGILSRVRAYQFHDTSDSARIRDCAYIDDGRFLYSDAGNLAAFLRKLKGNDKFRPYYDRIVRYIRRIMPQFGDFDLEPIPGNGNFVRLNWRDRSGEDYLFGTDQVSDGSLRFMAIATLLLQPPELLPEIIVIDEPELGLHPVAIAELGGLVRSVSQQRQIVLATESTRLVDEFSPENIVVVERDSQSQSTIFKTLDAANLQAWLEENSLSQLWEKNVLGGQP